MDIKNRMDPGMVLQAWRTRILNGFLALVAVAAAAMTVTSILDAVSRPGQWPTVILYTVLALVLAALAILRRIDNRIRAWGVLLVPYIVGVTALASYGLGSSGRLYLLALPVGALILIGVRSGLIMSALSILTMAIFSLLAERGALGAWLIGDRNSLLLTDWLAEGSDTLGLLVVVMVLLILFYRFQEGLIERERRAQADLLSAQALLEEQNATLEQKVLARTEELLQSKKIQTALYNIAEAASSSQAMPEFYAHIHRVVSELMYAENMYIALYDESSGLLSFPYFVDEKDEPFPTQPLDKFHGMTSYVIRTGKSIQHGWDQFNELIATQEVEPAGSFNEDGIGAPLKANGKILGAIFVQSYTRGMHYTEKDDEVLEFVAQHIATALTCLRAIEETHKRNSELQIINRVQEGLASKLDFQGIVDLVGEKVGEIFAADTTSVAAYDAKRDWVTNIYYVDRGQRIPWPDQPTSRPSLGAIVIDSHLPLLIGTSAESLKLGGLRVPPPGEKVDKNESYLGVPILAGEHVIGLVTVQSYEQSAFNQDNVRLLQTLANSMGAALENAHLFAETQRLLKETEQRNSELAIINSVQEGLASKLDMQAIYELIGEKIRQVFGVQVVDIVTYDPGANVISMPYSYEKGDRSVMTPREPYGFRLEVINSRAPLLINQNFVELAAQHNNPLITGDWPKSALFVPLLVEDRVKGIISIQDLDRENAYRASDVRLLQTLANAMSVALENARLFDETQRLLKQTEQRAAELATINTVSAALNSELDVSALIGLVGEQTRLTFNADIAYVALLDEAQGVINFPYTFSEELTPIRYGEGLTSKVLQTNQPLLINQELDRQALEIGATIVGKQSLSYLGVPIVVSGKAVGVLSVQSTTQEGVFDQNDARLLSTIASSVGTALHNAQLFSEVQLQKKFSEALIQSSPAAIVTMDRDNRVSSWNPAAEKLFGYRQAEALGQQIDSLIATYPEMRQEAAEYSRLVGQGEYVHAVTRRNCKDGRLVDVEVQAVPVMLEENRVGIFGIYHDITELKQAEAAILELERRLADIIDFLPDATLVIGREGEVIAWNKAIEEMTGVSAKEMLGKGDYEYALPFYGDRRPILIDLVLLPREEFEEKYVQIQRVGHTLVGETFTPSLKGGRYLYATASALHDSRGNIVGAIETIRDITRRKQAELELHKAKEAADAANASKSAFLANMSHELRTPLNAIIGFTRIVHRKTEGVIPEKQTENLDKVLASADHLLSLINTVLDIAKIEAGRMDVLAAAFRINSIVDSCANTVQPMLRPGVVLEKQVDEHLGSLYSDQDKIKQIVLNLLSNAAKFTHQGRIRLAARRAGDAAVRISVSDTGIGISPEALPRIFKEFQQADTSTTRQYGGTGLGLTISRDLARLLGGDLSVESEAGKGSTFTLTIPMHFGSRPLPPPEAAASPGGEGESEAQPEAGPAKKRILVIDDDPDAVYLLQENLDQKEFSILGTRNGRDGLRMAREQQPQAILLDIILPGTDGWQILHDLKEDPATANIPVILHTIVDKKALGFQLGAAAYLLKPLDPLAVGETLSRVIVQNREPWSGEQPLKET